LSALLSANSVIEALCAIAYLVTARITFFTAFELLFFIFKLGAIENSTPAFCIYRAHFIGAGFKEFVFVLIMFFSVRKTANSYKQ